MCFSTFICNILFINTNYALKTTYFNNKYKIKYINKKRVKMSSTLDNLQWQVKDLQEEIKILKKRNKWLLNYIEKITNYDKEILKDIKEHLKTFKKWKT